jgi:hypothetical protein
MLNCSKAYKSESFLFLKDKIKNAVKKIQKLQNIAKSSQIILKKMKNSKIFPKIPKKVPNLTKLPLRHNLFFLYFFNESHWSHFCTFRGDFCFVFGSF